MPFKLSLNVLKPYCMYFKKSSSSTKLNTKTSQKNSPAVTLSYFLFPMSSPKSHFPEATATSKYFVLCLRHAFIFLEITQAYRYLMIFRFRNLESANIPPQTMKTYFPFPSLTTHPHTHTLFPM